MLVWKAVSTTSYKMRYGYGCAARSDRTNANDPSSWIPTAGCLQEAPVAVSAHIDHLTVAKDSCSKGRQQIHIQLQ